MTRSKLFMETTGIEPSRSAAEITQALMIAGARSIAGRYEDGTIVGMSFTLMVEKQEVPFSLPVRVESLYVKFLKDAKRSQQWRGSTEQITKLRAKAERIAWRQLFRWVEAQLAMIETGMAQSAEVFMPYITGTNGQTMFENFYEQKVKALPAPEAKP